MNSFVSDSAGRGRRTKACRIEQYRSANELSARVIAADPVRYPGLIQEWARAVLTKVEPVAANATTKTRSGKNVSDV